MKLPPVALILILTMLLLTGGCTVQKELQEAEMALVRCLPDWAVPADLQMKLEEQEALAALLEIQELTGLMLAASLQQAATAKNPAVAEAARLNAAYFGVAARLAGLTTDLPPEVCAMVEQEYLQITDPKTSGRSELFPEPLDYLLFAPRQQPETPASRFNRTMAWYGQVPLKTSFKNANGNEQLIQAMLMTRALFRPGTTTHEGPRELWSDIMEQTLIYVDTLTPADYMSLMEKVYGARTTIDQLAHPARLHAFQREVQRLQKKHTPASPENCQFRFLGRYPAAGLPHPQQGGPDDDGLRSQPGPRWLLF